MLATTSKVSSCRDLSYAGLTGCSSNPFMITVGFPNVVFKGAQKALEPRDDELKVTPATNHFGPKSLITFTLLIIVRCFSKWSGIRVDFHEFDGFGQYSSEHVNRC